jgi:4-hydroxybenzoate polyprenyltransferase
LKKLLQAIRIHHFVKNLLVFVPLISGGLYTQLADIRLATTAFIAFCCATASVYLLNDCLDIETDRLHPIKKHRPLAAGELSLQTAQLAIPLFFLGSLVIGYYFVNKEFTATLGLYYLLTLAYSIYLKRLFFVDILVLSLFYTLRITAGIAAIDARYSPWLLSFSFCFFFSMALVKRYAELYQLEQQGVDKAHDKAYQQQHKTLIQHLGILSAAASIVILACYVLSDAVKPVYQHPKWLWGLPIVLGWWLARTWRLSLQGKVHEDPILFALHDKLTWLGLALSAIVLIMAH